MEDRDPQAARPAAAHGNARRQVGSEGLWIFVFIDMAIFTLIFFVFMSERLGELTLFEAGQRHLNPWFGLTNTLVLLTSSYLVVEAVHAARVRAAVRVQRCLLGALACGALFVASKVLEYRAKLLLGITPATDPFFSFYFFITFVHFLHVLAGMVFLNTLRRRSRQGADGPRFVTGLENIGLFWHYVDVLWIFIFPLLYLI